MGKAVWTWVLVICSMVGFIDLVAAAELSDEDYVTKYFGTSVVFITGKQLVDVRQGYWGEKLPQEFIYSQGELVDIINELRKKEGYTEMLNPADYPIGAGMEARRDDGLWEYSINFRGCRPSEAQAVLDNVEFTGVLADCEVEMRPVCVGYMAASSRDLEDAELVLTDTTATLTPDMNLKEILIAVKNALHEQYGDRCEADIYISMNDTVTGGEQSFYVNISVYLDGVEKQFAYNAYAEYEPNEM